MPYKDPAKRSEYLKEWRLANPEKVKQIQRRTDLKPNGWTPEMLVQTLREQGGRCAICTAHEPTLC